MTNRALAIAMAAVISGFAPAPIDEARDDGRPAPLIPQASQARDSARLVIAEVLFNPLEGDTAFVELLHVGERPVQLTAFVLRIDSVVLPLPRLAAPLAPGARVLIRFDGRNGIEDNVVHASPGFELRPAGGTVSIRRNNDDVVDEIAWGDAPGAFVPTIGGMAMRQVERGSSFGRPPGANRAGAPSDWIVYTPNAVTPGQPNPLPPVAQLLPIHGAILEGTSAELTWYPVPGAVRYRVQLARDTTFAQTLLNDTIADTRMNTGQLQAGEYWWRVQAIQADGAVAPWSRPQLIELGAASRGDDRDDTSGPSPSDDETHAATAPVLLNVPLIMQHKDTRMLHLESLQEGRQRTAGMQPRVPHAWDRDHGTLDKSDPVDNMNCALASLAMINRYYGGDLSQDRIGYEGWGPNVAKYRATILSSPVVSRLLGTINTTDLQEPEPGPERDLHFGQGTPWARLMAESMFALGTLPSDGSGAVPPYGSFTTDSLWDAIRLEIDSRRPVLGIVPGHAIVLRGYELRGSRRLIYVNDPWHSRYALNLDAAKSGPMNTALITIFTFGNVRPQSQEPEVSQDTDADGVVDFDETERFHTDPAKPDTDGDGVPDKQDIASGVYEAWTGVGYAYNPAHHQGRDYDFDGQPTELDPDSDNGGCKDGEEDVSKDGETNGTETGNFDQTDDVCGNLQGSVSYLIEAINTDTNAVARLIHDQGVILVKLRQESPGSEQYVDAGSTYSYQGHARTEIVLDQCILWGREVSRGAGPFTADNAEIGASRGDDSTLALGAIADVASQTSTGGCGASDAAPGQRTMNFPDCDGKLSRARSAAGPRPGPTYVFDCTTKPDLGPGWTVTRFYARGFVRVE